jgi:hypothetical protein
LFRAAALNRTLPELVLVVGWAVLVGTLSDEVVVALADVGMVAGIEVPAGAPGVVALGG